MQHLRQPLKEYQTAGKRDTDILYWMRRYRAQLPPIRIDCGTEDALLDSNRVLHKALLRYRIPHSYEEHPGGHDWVYWQQHVRGTLRFVSRMAHGEAWTLHPSRFIPAASIEYSAP